VKSSKSSSPSKRQRPLTGSAWRRMSSASKMAEDALLQQKLEEVIKVQQMINMQREYENRPNT
jgi:hypothetical protein